MFFQPPVLWTFVGYNTLRESWRVLLNKIVRCVFRLLRMRYTIAIKQEREGEDN